MKLDSISGFHEHYVEINRDVSRTPFPESPMRELRMLDDTLVFAKGATNPLVLRRVRDRTYQFIGPAVMVSNTDYYAGDTEFCSIIGSHTVCPKWERQSGWMKYYTLV